VFAILALLSLLGTVANRHPIRQIKQTLRIYRQEIRAKMQANELEVQHDNHFK
jgi:mxaL protein